MITKYIKMVKKLWMKINKAKSSQLRVPVKVTFTFTNHQRQLKMSRFSLIKIKTSPPKN
jgi:hypothetical protein